MIGKHYLACAFISVAMVAGCSNDQSQGDVIATVGDEAITDTQFDAYLKFKNVPARTPVVRRVVSLPALAAAPGAVRPPTPPKATSANGGAEELC